MNVYLLCRVFGDGDGYSQERPLEIFKDKDIALNYAVTLFLSETQEKLYDENGNKKEYKKGRWIDILSDGSRIEHFTTYFLPDTYYEKYELALNNQKEFIEKYISQEFEDGDYCGMEFSLTEMQIR